MTLQWQSLNVHKSIIPETSLYPSSILEAFRQTYILLHKASILTNALKLNEDEVGFLEQTSRGLPTLNLNGLPVSRNDSASAGVDEQAPRHLAAILRASRLVAFRRDLPSSDFKLTQLFAAPNLEHALANLGLATGWDAGLVSDLAAARDLICR